MNGLIASCFSRPQRAAGLLLVLTLTGAGGCADLRRATSLPPVNPESPVAPAVEAAAPRSYPLPRLSDVPPAPRNVATAATVKAGVLNIVRCRVAIRSFAPAHPPLSHGSDTFAADARDVAQINPADVPPPNSAALSEDLAARLRAFAAPPEAIGAGPPPTSDAIGPPVAEHVPEVAHRPTGGRTVSAAQAPPPAPVPVRSVQVAAPMTPVPDLPAPGPDPLLSRCL